jgi:glycosyltransferase involved in cell wall biosynthesis
MKVDVSVVVMTFNRPATLRRTLHSLERQSFPRERFEVVVVDGSSLPVYDVIKDFSHCLQIRHVVGPNLGPAGQRNRGVELARGDLVAFTDDDCVARPDWLEQLSSAISANPGVIVGGGVENIAPENACAAAGQVITEAVLAFFNPPGGEASFFPGLNFILKRQDYLDLGGCDARFGLIAAEDRDFMDRWRARGGRLVASPHAIVRHEHRATLRGFVRQYFNYGRGAWRYHRLRRLRGSGRMTADTKLHGKLYQLLRAPLGRLSTWMRWKVLLLVGVWEVANLLGFVWQALGETTGIIPQGIRLSEKQS